MKAGRKIIGATNPTDADCGTIRGDFGVEVGRNIVHGSDSVENGEREISKYTLYALHETPFSFRKKSNFLTLLCPQNSGLATQL